MSYKANIESSISLYDDLLATADNNYDIGKFTSQESYLAYKAGLLHQQQRYVQLLKQYKSTHNKKYKLI